MNQENLTDPNPRKKIWESLSKRDLYTKSFEDFERQFETPEMVNVLYDNLYGEQLYTNKLSDFVGKYYSDKYQVTDAGIEPVQKKNSVSNDGSSDSSSTAIAQNAVTGIEYSATGVAPTVDINPSLARISAQDDTQAALNDSIIGVQTPAQLTSSVESRSELYLSLVDKEGFPQSMSEFNSKYSTIDGQLDLYSKLKDQGETDQDFGDFRRKYFADLMPAETIPGDVFGINSEPEAERNPLKTLAKKAWSTLAYQIPATLAGAGAAMSEGAVMGATPGGGVIRPFNEMEMKEQIGESKKAMLSWALKHNKKGAENTANLINHYEQISDPIDALNYVFGAIGQGIPQIATTAATGGIGGFGQSIGGIYMDEVEKLAQDYNLTPAQVIELGLDDTPTAIAFGTVAGSLESIGAGKVLGGLTKSALQKSLRGRAMAFLSAAGSEGLTETAQSTLEQVGSDLGANRDPNVNWKDVLNEGLIGAISGGGMNVGGQVLNSAVSRIKQEEDITIEKANEIIQEEKQAAEEASAEGRKEIAAPEVRKTQTSEESIQEGDTNVADIESQPPALIESPQPTASTLVQAVQRENEITKALNPQPGVQTQFGTVEDVVEDQVMFEGGNVMSLADYRASIDTSNNLRGGLNKTQNALVDRLAGLATPDPVTFSSQQVGNIQKALSQIGDFQVIEHDSNEAIQQVAAKAGLQLSPEDTLGGVRIGNQIHINKQDAQKSTLAHEAIHPILEAAVSTETKRLANEIRSLDWDQVGRIEEQYGDNADKEIVTEYIAQVASGDIKLEETTFEKVKNFFKDILNKIGLGGKVKLDTTADVQSLARSISRALNKGQVIDAQAQEMSQTPEAQLLESQNVLRARSIVAEFAPLVGPELSQEELIDQVSEALNVDKETVGDMVARAKYSAKNRYFNSGSNQNFFSQSIVAPLKSFHSKWLSASRGAPKIISDLRDGMNGAVSAEIDNSYRKVKEVQALLKDKDISNEEITSYLQGQDLGIPDDVAVILDEMRIQIDKLSQMLIDEGYVFGETKETVKNNLGKYLTRAYRLHLDPNYTPTEAVQENAVRYFKTRLRALYRDQADSGLAEDGQRPPPINPDGRMSYAQMEEAIDNEARAIVGEIISQRDLPKKWNSSIGRDTGILKQKGELAPEVRELLGEYNHPLEAYVWSVYKLANLYYGTKFLADLQAVGMGKFLFVGGDPRSPRPAQATVKLAGENSDAFFPMNVSQIKDDINVDEVAVAPYDENNQGIQRFKKQDIFTTPEVYEAITQSSLNANSWSDKLYTVFRGAMMSQEGWWQKPNGWVNWGKTVGSPGTHTKNVLGNIPFLLSNGYVNPLFMEFNAGSFKQAYDAILVDLGVKYNDTNNLSKDQLLKLDQLNKMLDYLKTNGVIGQNIAIGTVKDLMNSNQSPDEFFQAHLNRKRTISEKAMKKVLKGKESLDALYGAEDDIFKIFAFTIESNRYAEAIYGRKYSELTESQKAEVDDLSSDIVKKVLPNYSKLGELAKTISRSPVLGNFIAFRAESFRVAYNSLEQAFNEVRSDNPKVRRIGASRLVGTVQANALRASIVGAFGALAGIGVQGLVGAAVDDEDEKEKQEAIRSFVYPWLKKSDLIVHEAKDGIIRIHDASGVDPYNAIQRIMNSGLYGSDKGMEVVKEVLGPFVDETILLNAGVNVLSGTDNYGRRIWYPNDTDGEKWFNGSTHILRTLAPGVYNTSLKIYEDGGKEYIGLSPYVGAEPISKIGLNTVAGQFLGTTYYEVDTKKVFFFRLQEWIKSESGMRKKYRDEMRKAIKEKDTTPERLADINADVKMELDKLKDFYDNAVKLGAEPSDLRRIMKDSRLTKADQIYISGGAFQPWRFEDFKQATK